MSSPFFNNNTLHNTGAAGKKKPINHTDKLLKHSPDLWFLYFFLCVLIVSMFKKSYTLWFFFIFLSTMSWSEIKPILKTKTKTKPKSKKKQKKNPDFHLEESLYANEMFWF